jgi:ribosomal protein L11 methylase PrmA
MIPDPGLPDPAEIQVVGGSFRDPSGYVFRAGDRIFRSVNPPAAENFGALEKSGLLQRLAEAGLVLPAWPVTLQPGMEKAFAGPRGETPFRLIEHPLIPFITYPYEWCFSQLKDAALAHLDLQVAALEAGFVLSDATPYNMQFHVGRPVHIDILSLRAYHEGELWQGYNQFCRMFLAPLLVEAWTGVGFQTLLRGRIDALPIADISNLLPRRRMFTSLQAFIHVYLQGRAETKSSSSVVSGRVTANRPLPRSRYLALLSELRRFIARLESRKRSKSFWKDYAAINSYSDETRSRKVSIVRDFVAGAGARRIVDIGGNTGDYSRAALEAGAGTAIVLDGDNDSVEAAYQRAKAGLDGLSAWLVDITDPSPALGWNGRERESLTERLRADGMLALAVIHHMCIGRNIPLRDAVHWLVGLAPRGIIEFVPKTDAMVKQMLSGRDDPFHDYDLEHCLGYINEVAEIARRSDIEGSDRVFIEYARRTA